MSYKEHILNEVGKVIDVGALGVTIAALMQVIPSITALASLIWVFLRIYHSILDIRLKKRELEK